jgi:hypothetical protein
MCHPLHTALSMSGRSPVVVYFVSDAAFTVGSETQIDGGMGDV